MIFRILLQALLLSLSSALSAQTGVLKSYDEQSIYAKKSIKLGCKYFNTQMELIRGLPYLMCLPLTVERSNFLFFTTKKHYWLVMDGEYAALLDETLQEKWHHKGLFNHDIAWDPDRQLLWTIQEEIRQINGENYSYFALHAYNLAGEQVEYWSAYENLDVLTTLGHWKTLKGVKFPLTARSAKRNTVLMANYLHRLEQPWQTGQNTVLPKGTLLVNLRYLNVLIALDKDHKIIWSYHFNPNPQDSVHFDIHTPQLAEQSKIIAFVNSIEVDSKIRSGVFTYDTKAKTPKPHLNYLVPIRGPEQESRSGAFGSVQVLNDQSLFISTGSEYGGIIHINAARETLFEWINPKTSKSVEEGKTIEYPTPIYRASLVNLDWIETL